MIQSQVRASAVFAVTAAVPYGSGIPRWPELVHPFASAIDTPLPIPPERTHLMLGSKASWVKAHEASGDQHFDEYPEESIAAWHERVGLDTGND